eukprot:s3697_g6.t1
MSAMFAMSGGTRPVPSSDDMFAASGRLPAAESLRTQRWQTNLSKQQLLTCSQKTGYASLCFREQTVLSLTGLLYHLLRTLRCRVEFVFIHGPELHACLVQLSECIHHDKFPGADRFREQTVLSLTGLLYHLLRTLRCRVEFNFIHGPELHAQCL